MLTPLSMLQPLLLVEYATALSSYGGFWIAFAIVLTPGFAIPDAYKTTNAFNNCMGLFLMAS